MWSLKNTWIYDGMGKTTCIRIGMGFMSSIRGNLLYDILEGSKRYHPTI
jgi:ABC-type transport system involved in cytochrome c biogenesis ATPase subunit